MKRRLKVAYQGVPGAYSYMAAGERFDNAELLGYATFEEAINSVRSGEADMAFLPIENSTAGRVASMHLLLPKSNLFIVGEYYFKVKHTLISKKGIKFTELKRVYSHPQALAQCSEFIKNNKLEEIPFGDTAAAVEFVSKSQDNDICAIASEISAKIYEDVKIIKRNINNSGNNTTRFIILSSSKRDIEMGEGVKTSIFYETKNIPAALYKSLSGFATASINVTKLESFVPLFSDKRASFYLEFESHPNTKKAKQALLELSYYADNVKILGVYKKER